MTDKDIQDDTICKRCNTSIATLQARNEQFCEKCFILYVSTKAVKRLDMYRPRGSFTNIPRRILLPLSLGVSSTSLLYILDAQVQAQLKRMGRAFYEIILVNVDLAWDNIMQSEEALLLLNKVQQRFPEYRFISAKIEDALDLPNIKWDTLGIAQPDETLSGKERVHTFLTSVSEPTSRADIISILMTLLLADMAKRNNCEYICFGDSTTRLAEKTLTETAKGRGFALPWQVSDGISPYGVYFHYPLRDVLRKELVTFCSVVEPSLTDLIYSQNSSQSLNSLKSTTINDLMASYFDSVEENFPSIVANVVRTTSKLKAGADTELRDCDLCGLPVALTSTGVHGWGGDQNSVTRSIGLSMPDQSHLCYGCSRSINS